MTKSAALALLALAAMAGLGADRALAAGSRTVDFNRDIRPIFSDHCFACHGPDEKQRKAKLRLDLKEGVFKAGDSGLEIVRPKSPDKSELFLRITTADEDDRMPPSKGAKPLSPAQIETLKRWIQEGAEWAGHWAYEKPERPELPPVQRADWAVNEIDRFILARLEKAGLEPSAPADKRRLLRRVTLDLTGLPPTPQEVDDFVKDSAAEAYEKVVERLLKSKQYGERMALFWLDLARFADTQGYHHDAHRDMYHWRDWVIEAFNQNMPFDQFTIEQLAGDLLPDPTQSQKIATGFHRNEMTTSEGGAMPEEYSVKYVAGRVDVTSRVWLGTSMACAECHDHKYDPITQKDYYRFFAYFNAVPENGLDASQNPVPRLMLGSAEQNSKLAQLDKEIAQLEALDKSLLEEAHADRDRQRDEWLRATHDKFVASWEVLKPGKLEAKHGASLEVQEDLTILAGGTLAPKEIYELKFATPRSKITGLRIEAIPHDSLPGKKSGRGEKGQFLLTRIEAAAAAAKPEAVKVLGASQAEPWWSLGPFAAGSAKEAFDKKFGPEDGVDLKKTFEEGKIAWQERPEFKDGERLAVTGDKQATFLYRKLEFAQAGRAGLLLESGGGLQVWINGRRIHSREPAEPAPAGGETIRPYFKAGENTVLIKVSDGAQSGASFRISADPVTEHSVDFAAAAADFNGGGYSVKGILDDKNTTGWSVGSEDAEAGRPHSAFVRLQDPAGFEGGTEIRLSLKFESPTPGLALGRFRVSLTSADGLEEFLELPDAVRAGFLTPAAERSKEVALELQRHYRRTFVPEIKQWVKTLEEQRKARNDYRNGIPVAMVMEDMAKPRDTFFLIRGEFNNRGDKVEPGVPARLMPMPEGLPANRLGLAKWLVDPDHPLTARVTVNHFWQQYFGTGLVKTAEDFGSQGEWPSHPDLLDWLATEFIRTGWDVKGMQRRIVLSATYRQGAEITPDHLRADPENRLLARFPRLRLEAEAIRDNAMAVGGLLDPRIGGPSVFPYQPPGLWEQVAFEGTKGWQQSAGKDNYRRGIYTYWRRSIPYPSLITFDAPTRETCTIRRPRTNTPLQALVLMNDPVYVEASRALGYRIMKEGGSSIRERVEFAFKLCLARPPSARERRLVESAYKREFKTYTEDRVAAARFVHVGASEPPLDADICELAAWTAIGNLLLNLDETVNKG